ncbi:hypothetical protein V8G57_25490 [Collimonas sp. H4R21]|uniref:Uncharacterized protein n=1 Tax=Collimonas rhizosphaerae TaxID=3126357 RepID=A0ABU9Q3H9_9BURK
MNVEKSSGQVFGQASFILSNPKKLSVETRFLIEMVILKTSIILMCDCMSWTINAQASSANAWIKHHENVVDSCIKISQLNDAKPAGSPVEFPDSAGYTAIMLQGHMLKGSMKKAKSRALCLFNKRTQTAYVADAEMMSAKK